MEVEKNFIEIIEEQKLKWFGYMKRMKEERIPKMILVWAMEGRR